MAKSTEPAPTETAAPEPEAAEPRELTLGEYRVGVSFNPSGDELVAKIKADTAALLDLIESIPTDVTGEHVYPNVNIERIRLKQIATQYVEDAAMWAVKAATKR